MRVAAGPYAPHVVFVVLVKTLRRGILILTFHTCTPWRYFLSFILNIFNGVSKIYVLLKIVNSSVEIIYEKIFISFL